MGVRRPRGLALGLGLVPLGRLEGLGLGLELVPREGWGKRGVLPLPLLLLARVWVRGWAREGSCRLRRGRGREQQQQQAKERRKCRGRSARRCC